jgi:hypothetical protein
MLIEGQFFKLTPLGLGIVLLWGVLKIFNSKIIVIFRALGIGAFSQFGCYWNIIVVEHGLLKILLGVLKEFLQVIFEVFIVHLLLP